LVYQACFRGVLNTFSAGQAGQVGQAGRPTKTSYFQLKPAKTSQPA